ncbi:MAG: DUF2058 family protein [Gammaproteobacteria bacterium]|nr:DUF2058 family protein [Gammaproteobacteria bacterium]
MANSLQDQLRKSGLVSAQKSRQANAEKRKKKRRQRAGETDTGAQQQAAAMQQRKAEKLARDQALNAAREATAQAKAISAQIRQLVAMNRIAHETDEDGIPYHFVVDGKVRKLHMTGELHRAVTAGQVAIVHDEDGFSLVPSAAAEKIKSRDADKVVVLNDRSDDIADEDDPYAQFKVPDDLMW